MPTNSAASQRRLTSHKPQQKYFHCNSVPIDKFPAFNKTKYGENGIVSQMTENDEQKIICNKCQNIMLRQSLVTCLACDKTMKKMLTLKFGMDKYSLLENKTQQMLKTNRMNCYICKSYHLQLQPKCTYVWCNTDVQKDISKMYNKVEYDFTSFVVSQCLGHVSNSGNEEQYICPSCDKRLKETSNENPVLPYYGKYPNAVAGANFLKAKRIGYHQEKETGSNTTYKKVKFI